jgi:hypothetical protein
METTSLGYALRMSSRKVLSVFGIRDFFVQFTQKDWRSEAFDPARGGVLDSVPWNSNLSMKNAAPIDHDRLPGHKVTVGGTEKNQRPH